MEHQGLDFAQILLSSGLVVKGVLILLIIISVATWAVIFDKLRLFKKEGRESKEFDEVIKKVSSLGSEKVESAVVKMTVTPKASMFLQGKEQFSKVKGNEDYEKYIERVLANSATHQIQGLEKRLDWLASFSSVAPFIGLFGTVWGIIDAFAGLAQGGGSLEYIAPGIAEALVATAVGLAAAIPALWAYNIFQMKLTRIKEESQTFSQEFINRCYRVLHKE